MSDDTQSAAPIPHVEEIDDLWDAYRYDGIRKVRDNDGTVYDLRTDDYLGKVYLVEENAEPEYTDPQTETVNMAKGSVESAQLATGLWSDALRLTSQKMERMDADAFDIQINITVREAPEGTEGKVRDEFIRKVNDADEGDVMLFDEAEGNVENLSDGDDDE